MVQVLPAVPGFGERLIETLSQAGSNVARGLQQRNAMTALQQALNPMPTAEMNSQQGNASSPMSSFPQAQPQSELNPSKVLQLYSLAEKAVGADGAKQLANAYIEKQKLASKEAAETRKYEHGLIEPGMKQFFEKVEGDRIKLPEARLANEMIVDSIKSGDIDPWSGPHLGKIAVSFGAPPELVTALETPGSKEFKTARKTFIGNTIKDAFRGTTTKTEINLAEDMLAELGVSKEANLASAWAVQSRLDLDQERLRLHDQLLQEGVSPSKIPYTVDKMMQPYIKETKDEYFEALRSLRKMQHGK